jgi:DNA helicase-2/ATP-dependent DNA helicase PcrA
MGNEIALTDFLQEVALLTDLDSDKDSDQPKVSLMTIHSAKGLEFPVVFIVGLEENIFPSPMCTNSMRELEEERRLLYVAITRAEKHCILTCAENRFRFGRMEFDTPSRFIRDIDPQLLHVDGNNHFAPFPARERPGVGLQNAHPVATQFKADPMRRAVPRSKPEPAVDPLSPQFKQLLHTASGGRFKPLSSLRNTSAAASSSPRANANVTTPLPTREGQGESLLLREGTVIEHQRFGIGTVVRLEGTGDNEKATVDFRNAGTKQLLLKFARYKIVKP